tara:strand:+ start:952 stop:1185 length:234 start_codon:yes stop_codon:yes gene_type:complete
MIGRKRPIIKGFDRKQFISVADSGPKYPDLFFIQTARKKEVYIIKLSKIKRNILCFLILIYYRIHLSYQLQILSVLL